MTPSTLTAVPPFLAPRGGYRNDAAAGGFVARAAGRHLATASDALSLALLTLGGERGDDRKEKLRRAEQARGFLVEAVTSLSRARIYVRGIRTHALPVVMASEANPDAELQRLHQIATRLLWQNHAYLPARLQAKPLAPEEEAQLAVVLQGIARGAKIERALRYKWAGLALVTASAGLILGLHLFATMGAVGAVLLALWRVARDRGAEAIAARG